MFKLFRNLPRLQPAEAVILIADLSINTGFFMLVPFISIHVTNNLGLSATVAGVVLATRMGVQQLIQIVAGPTADLYGYKRVLVLGLIIRAVGFISFAFMSDLPGLMLSAVLSALGGALFSSSSRATFAALANGEQLAAKYSILYTFQSIGTTLGPLVGALLLAVDFRLLSLVAGLVYLPVALLVYLMLPNLETGRTRPRAVDAVGEVLRSISTVARHRDFVIFCLINSGFWLLSGQINISLSLYAAAITGTQTSVKYLFLLNSLIAITLQYGVSQRLQGRASPYSQWAVGAALAALGFLILIPFPSMGGLIACVALMGLGGLVLRPNEYMIINSMSPRNALASYYGFSSLAPAIGGATGQYLGGRLTDLASETGAAWIPWVIFSVIGWISSVAMFRFSRYRAEQERRTALGA